MKKTKNMSPDASVPFIEKMGFSIGGQGANFYIMILGSFLMVYYTNVIGISAGVVATVMGVSKILDGVSDLIAGYILDHTRTKYGKCRPWLLRMIIPTAICMLLLFYVPAGMEGVLKTAYIFVTYNLVNTVCLTMLSVAHAALNGSMSMNQKDRGLNGGFMMVFGIAGGLILNSTVLQITSAVGGGDPYTQKGWTAMLLIYTVVYVGLSLFGFFCTTERVTLAQWEKNEESGSEEKGRKDSEIKVLEALKILLHDKYWVIFVLTMICVLYMQTSSGMSNIYFAQYVLGDVFIYTPLANFSSIGALAGSVLTLILMTKMKKRNVCMTGLILGIIGSILPAISHNMLLLYISSSTKGVGMGVAACVLPGMLQDSISYAQWQSGRDVLGMGNAAYSFCNKLGASLGTILFGWLLEAGGFDGTLAVQPAGAVAVINVLYIWIPVVGTALSIVCMYFYDLDNIFDKVAADLKERMGCQEKTEIEEK